MSEQTEGKEAVDQITREPPKEVNSSKNKEKDPKKVAAGKKLAEYNKKAKEALAREMKREETLRAAEQNENTYSESNQAKPSREAKSWIPELSFTTVLSVVGLGFTAFDLFMRYREKARDGHTEYKNRIPDLSQVPQPITSQPTDRPKIGMM